MVVGESRSSQEARRAAERRARGLHVLAGIHLLGVAGYCAFSPVLFQASIIDSSALGLLFISILTVDLFALFAPEHRFLRVAVIVSHLICLGLWGLLCHGSAEQAIFPLAALCFTFAIFPAIVRGVLTLDAWVFAGSLTMPLIGIFVPPLCDVRWQLLPASFLAALGAPALLLGFFTLLGRRDEGTIGGYTIQKLLGNGGMGDVYLARHRLLARRAAIKLIRPSCLPGEETTVLARFEREAQATAQLSSPHTVCIYDYGRTSKNEFYYIMEYLDGLDLDTLVSRHGPLPPERAIFLIRQACLSLAEAHADGLIHRDIKPANIFSCRLGLSCDFVKVLDFGLVMNQFAGGANSRLTRPGMVNGTPEYMSPEQATASRMDHRADIYSLGCVLWWCLTGATPFKAKDTAEMLNAQVRKPVPDLNLALRNCPTALAEIIAKCMAKDPADRPQSALVLWRDLGEITLPERWSTSRARAWWDQHIPPDRG